MEDFLQKITGKEKPREINENSTNEEIADIVSDRVMEVLKKELGLI